VDLRAGLDDLEKRKFFNLPGLELQPVASCYTDYAIPALFKKEIFPTSDLYFLALIFQ
jgi:hypothetical protein